MQKKLLQTYFIVGLLFGIATDAAAMKPDPDEAARAHVRDLVRHTEKIGAPSLSKEEKQIIYEKAKDDAKKPS